LSSSISNFRKSRARALLREAWKITPSFTSARDSMGDPLGFLGKPAVAISSS
jgi:hypothetical protein